MASQDVGSHGITMNGKYSKECSRSCALGPLPSSAHQSVTIVSGNLHIQQAVNIIMLSHSFGPTIRNSPHWREIIIFILHCLNKHPVALDQTESSPCAHRRINPSPMEMLMDTDVVVIHMPMPMHNICGSGEVRQLCQRNFENVHNNFFFIHVGSSPWYFFCNTLFELKQFRLYKQSVYIRHVLSKRLVSKSKSDTQ